MAILGIGDIASAWLSAGGSLDAVAEAVAVALAESGGNSEAISPTSDYGLWQINAGNFADHKLTTATALQVGPNAATAVSMSGGGANWGPWCTAWAQPVGNCGHYLGPVLQPGSPAAGHLAHVQAVLGLGPPAPAPPAGNTDTTAIQATWRAWVYLWGPWASYDVARRQSSAHSMRRYGT